MKKLLIPALFALFSVPAFAALPSSGVINLEGVYPGHLQDIWCDGTNIWWMHTEDLLKTDLNGKILVKTHVKGHHAGCEIKDGHLYVAVCTMQSLTGGKTLATSRVQVNEYDAATLKLIAEHPTDVNDRAGSLAILPDGTFIVGCLRPPEITPTQVRFHHFDRSFKLIRSYVHESGPQRLGIEVIKRHGDFLYLFCYDKSLCMKLDAKTYKEVARAEHVGGQVGMTWQDGEAWVAHTKKEKDEKDTIKGWSSKLTRATKKAKRFFEGQP